MKHTIVFDQKIHNDLSEYSIIIEHYGLGSEHEHSFLLAMHEKYQGKTVNADPYFIFCAVRMFTAINKKNKKEYLHCPESAKGEFYTAQGLCKMKEEVRHNLIYDVMRLNGQNIAGVISYHCVFRRQPETPEEIKDVLNLFPECSSLRYAGHDRHILHQLKEKGLENRCDE